MSATTKSFSELIAERIGPAPMVSTEDVAAAFHVDGKTVQAWREAGEFAGRCANIGSGTKRERWVFMREAVVDLAKRREDKAKP